MIHLNEQPMPKNLETLAIDEVTFDRSVIHNEDKGAQEDLTEPFINDQLNFDGLVSKGYSTQRDPLINPKFSAKFHVSTLESKRIELQSPKVCENNGDRMSQVLTERDTLKVKPGHLAASLVIDEESKDFHLADLKSDSDDEGLDPVCDENKQSLKINNQFWHNQRKQPGDLIIASETHSREETKNTFTSNHYSNRCSTEPEKQQKTHSSSFSSAAQIVENDLYIPCLYLPKDNGASKIIIYFHGNAEDIGLAYDLLYRMGQDMEMHVLAIEYPAYGLYKMCPPDENQIKEDAEIVYKYLTKHIGIRHQDIILFGRSMGSGPATHLASLYPAHSLLLMSPYTSIKDVARTLLGRLSFLLTPLVYERFRNIDTIKRAQCPVFLLHGMQDTLIPPSHAQDLYNSCPTFCKLQLAPYMDHNEFDFLADLIRPFKEFIGQVEEQRGRENLGKGFSKTLRTESASKIIIYSDIDSSGVEYTKGSYTFSIGFDPFLFSPPQSVVRHEKKLEEEKRQNEKS